MVVAAVSFMIVAGLVKSAEWRQSQNPVLVEEMNSNVIVDWAIVDWATVDWVVVGTDDTYNGNYTEAGTHDGKPYYIKAAPVRYLAWDEESAQWTLEKNLLAPTFSYCGTGADLPANDWWVDSGIPPAPTLSEAEEKEEEEEEECDGEIVLQNK